MESAFSPMAFGRLRERVFEDTGPEAALFVQQVWAARVCPTGFYGAERANGVTIIFLGSFDRYK